MDTLVFGGCMACPLGCLQTLLPIFCYLPSCCWCSRLTFLGSPGCGQGGQSGHVQDRRKMSLEEHGAKRCAQRRQGWGVRTSPGISPGLGPARGGLDVPAFLILHFLNLVVLQRGKRFLHHSAAAWNPEPQGFSCFLRWFLLFPTLPQALGLQQYLSWLLRSVYVCISIYEKKLTFIDILSISHYGSKILPRTQTLPALCGQHQLPRSSSWSQQDQICLTQFLNIHCSNVTNVLISTGSSVFYNSSTSPWAPCFKHSGPLFGRKFWFIPH